MAHAALATATGGERRRVKVYELKNNDWYDRGTGFCTGQLVNPPTATPENLDARILVVSEDEPTRTLLETRITNDDGYQKQQETLIVWTEANGVDMALSFQEAEGCASIWDFVSEIRNRLAALAPDDALSDDILDPGHPIVLPEPTLGRLEEVEATIRAAASSPTGRDALVKFIMHPEHMYIMKLAPLVSMAEDLESVADLHKLCTIMKHLILLNDTAIIEFVVTDQAVMGVVGALEYDPDFPSHRANHRQYLSDSSKFREVVPIQDPEIRRKIHWTYRLQYLKDVVLARILDDPTFSVLNSLIFFHQVDIVNHLQSNQEFLQDLFAIFGPEEQDASRKKEAVLFIQNCCAVSKNIQAQSRAQLYQHFINHGLFTVITFALRHHDAAVRVAGTDVLVALIDHDALMVRSHIFSAIRDKTTPLTDTLIELLLVEVDLGVKSQMADAIKILLDPITAGAGLELMNRSANGDVLAKQRAAGGAPTAAMQHQNLAASQTLQFIESFYETSAKRLFGPLKALESRPDVTDLSVQEASLFTHLVEVLCFFVRQHSHRSKGFILGEHLHSRIAQLLGSPQKYMKLAALKWFRTCIGLQDELHNRQLIQFSLFEPILSIVEETMPRDNLLNSACLELFEYIKRESVRQLIVHLVESYRDRLMAISYVNTFQALVLKYDQFDKNLPGASNGGDESFSTQEGTPQRMVNGRQAFSGLKEMDTDEQAYFEGEDELDDDDESLPTVSGKHLLVNGASPVRPLVNYPDDDDDTLDLLASSPDQAKEIKNQPNAVTAESSEAMEEDSASPTEGVRGRNRAAVPLEGSPGQHGHQQSPPESLAVKRRRQDEDDEDELGKIMGGVKRRNSSTAAAAAAATPGGNNNKASHTGLVGSTGSPVQRHLESSNNGGLQQVHIPSSPDHAHGNTNPPTLRRKGSLKTRNETTPATTSIASNVAIKPISLSITKSQGDTRQENDDDEGGGSNSSSGGSG